MKKLLILVTVFFGTYALVLAQNQQLPPESKKVITDLIKDGYMKIDYDLDKAWISPRMWHGWNVDEKELVTFVTSMYIRNYQKDSKTPPMVDMYDYKSGKHLASYGPLRGFKIIN